MTEKIFKLWDRHTTGCCRALFISVIPAAIFPIYHSIYSCFLLILWLIIKTGYEKEWDKEEQNNDGE